MIETLFANFIAMLIGSKWFWLGALAVLLFTFVFWALWVTLNVAYNRKKRLVYKVLLYLLVIPGALVDVLYNKTVAFALFREWGQESTLSMRLTRYLKTKDHGPTLILGFDRVRLAVWLADNLIEPWSKGHIGLERFGYPAARDAMAWLMKLVP